MKTYTIVKPSLDGLLSDDNLYFEGISKPSIIYKIRDGEDLSKENMSILEKYFNDVYNLFLRKISAFAIYEHTDTEEEVKLQALLQELIKIKKLIVSRENEG